MNTMQLAFGIFLAGAAAMYLLVRIVLSWRARPAQVWRQQRPDAITEDLADLLPPLPEVRRELQQSLYLAGRYQQGALTEYLAVRAVLVTGALIATGLIVLVVPQEQLFTVLIGGGLVAGLGFSLPRLFLSGQAKARERRLLRSLPLGMDVIALCLTAGQNVLGSLAHTGRALASSCPDLALELRIIEQQSALHSLDEALARWAERLDVAEIRSLALLLRQSDRLGTDMVHTLIEVADNQRTLQRQRAEAQANRANFWMLFPTLFCLWIAAAIVLIGPVYIEFWTYRTEQMKLFLGNTQGVVSQTQGQTTTFATPTEQAPTTATPNAGE